TATVPNTARNGVIAVTTANGTAKAARAFWVDSLVETGFGVAALRNNAYRLQADEWNSSAAFRVASDGGIDLRVIASQMASPSNGPPGAYPSLYRGCHWGLCTAASGLPIAVTKVMTAGTVKTTFRTGTITTGVWDDALDIWFNPSASTANNQTGLEMMVWLTKHGSVQPLGSVKSAATSIGGRAYAVWYGGPGRKGGTVSLVLSTPVSAVSGLDLAPL